MTRISGCELIYEPVWSLDWLYGLEIYDDFVSTPSVDKDLRTNLDGNEGVRRAVSKEGKVDVKRTTLSSL